MEEEEEEEEGEVGEVGEVESEKGGEELFFLESIFILVNLF